MIGNATDPIAHSTGKRIGLLFRDYFEVVYINVLQELHPSAFEKRTALVSKRYKNEKAITSKPGTHVKAEEEDHQKCEMLIINNWPCWLVD